MDTLSQEVALNSIEVVLNYNSHPSSNNLLTISSYLKDFNCSPTANYHTANANHIRPREPKDTPTTNYHTTITEINANPNCRSSQVEGFLAKDNCFLVYLHSFIVISCNNFGEVYNQAMMGKVANSSKASCRMANCCSSSRIIIKANFVITLDFN